MLELVVILSKALVIFTRSHLPQLWEGLRKDICRINNGRPDYHEDTIRKD